MLCLWLFSPASAQTTGALPEAVIKIMKGYQIPKDSLSLYIKQHHAKRPLVAWHADKARNPASVIKLLTTYAGLELLGPNYTWKTRFYLDGRLVGHTLHGNLIIKGGGDPFMVTETFWHILHTLRNRGIKHITGDLLLDDRLFEDEQENPADFDNRPYRMYNAIPNAILLNLRAHQFHLLPRNDRVHIYADPPTANLQIRNRLKLISGRCKSKAVQLNVLQQGQGSTLEFRGNYARSCGGHTLSRSVLVNDAYVFGVFKALWEEMGGTIAGGFAKTSINKGKPFYRVSSKPLREIIVQINKHSNNIMSRQLLLTLGMERFGPPANKAAGRRAIRDWLDHIGLPKKGLTLDNGAGLSRDTRISARSMAYLLEYILNRPYQPELLASLPMVGVDGTVKKRLNGHMVPGSARIKTGLLRDVRTMAGYVQGKHNKRYIVVSLQNHTGIQSSPAGNQIQDAILKWLYRQ